MRQKEEKRCLPVLLSAREDMTAGEQTDRERGRQPAASDQQIDTLILRPHALQFTLSLLPALLSSFSILGFYRLPFRPEAFCLSLTLSVLSLCLPRLLPLSGFSWAEFSQHSDSESDDAARAAAPPAGRMKQHKLHFKLVCFFNSSESKPPREDPSDQLQSPTFKCKSSQVQ